MASTTGFFLTSSAGFFFVARTDEEISLVCETARVPENTLAREDGWRAFRVEEGPLDFSLVGILSRILLSSGPLTGDIYEFRYRGTIFLS